MLNWINDLLKFTWLNNLVEIIIRDWLGISVTTQLGSSVHFFIYSSIKILILLGVMIFIISYIRSYFPPERTKKILSRFKGITGNIIASLLGIVTPFCSCSSVPIFIGFVESGVPLGVTFSFLITSPIVHEAAFAVLLASFGWKLAVLYVLTGVLVGVVGGLIIGKLKLEKEVEQYVYEINIEQEDVENLNNKQRINFAVENVKNIIKRIWLFLILGIGIGAFIYGWAPEQILSKYAGPDNPLSVIVATIIAVPLYSNILGTIPIAEALISKGVGLGTAMSFMMATTALSLPEVILLRKVIKPKLIIYFVAITSIAIILVGYLFNLVAHILI